MLLIPPLGVGIVSSVGERKNMKVCNGGVDWLGDGGKMIKKKRESAECCGLEKCGPFHMILQILINKYNNLSRKLLSPGDTW
jgi:hypothetical protein